MVGLWHKQRLFFLIVGCLSSVDWFVTCFYNLVLDCVMVFFVVKFFYEIPKFYFAVLSIGGLVGVKGRRGCRVLVLLAK